MPYLIKNYSFIEKIKEDFNERKVTCLIFGNFGAKNLGDEALLAGQLEQLKSLKNKITIFVVAKYPEDIKKIFNVKGISLYSISLILKTIRKTDFIIFGGGGLICKNTNGFLGLLFQFYMLFMFLLLPILLKKKIYVVGIGIYKNANAVILFFVKTIFRYIDFISARDSESLKLLKRSKIDALLVKDSSYFLPLLKLRTLLKRSKFFLDNYNENKINIGFVLKKSHRNKDIEHLKNAIGFLVKNYSSNVTFWFYSLDCNSNITTDGNFNRYLTQGIVSNKNFNIIYVPNNLHPQIIFSSFKLMNLIIAMRLHGMIFAHRNKIPFIGIPYDLKCRLFLSSIKKEYVETHYLTNKLKKILHKYE